MQLWIISSRPSTGAYENVQHKKNKYNYASIEEGTLSTIDVAEHTLHYWLRPFEGVQFRFDNLGSHFILVQIFHIYSFNLAPHFIRIQIFQIDFEETK